MTAKMYYEKDSDKNILKKKTIAVIGYGSQGHAQAQNLRDSGIHVLVADLPDSENYRLAIEHNFSPLSAAEASSRADIIHILLPDEIQKKVYTSEVAEKLTSGKALAFSHGFNIHFGEIKPPKDVDVYMVAPKGPGHLVRRLYEQGAGVPSLIAVAQDTSGAARELALAHACGIGSGRAGIIETTFKEETESDLFGEQVVLCGGLTELIRAGFETLVKAGYQPEIAYFECLHEVKLIVDLIYEKGITGMRDSISDTAEYGDLTRGKRIITQDTRREMQKILEDVQNGKFAQEWIRENEAGRPEYSRLKEKEAAHLIEETGRKLRNMMNWIHD